MRAGFRDLLIRRVPALEGRVYDMGAGSVETPKPFAIVREVVERQVADWGDIMAVVEVWPYVSRTKFKTLDGLTQEIVDGLHNQAFTDGGASFYVQYEISSGDDIPAQEWQAITRGLRFSVFNTTFLSGETYAPDPIVGLNELTQTWFPEVQTDSTSWTPSSESPGIYWRLSTVHEIAMVNWGAWIGAEFRAHIVAPSPQVRAAYTRRLVEYLAMLAETPLPDGSPLLFDGVAGNPDADAVLSGQVSLTAMYGVLKDDPSLDLVGTVQVAGNLNGTVN